MHFSIDRTVHTTAFDKPVVDHWLERKILAGEGYHSYFQVLGKGVSVFHPGVEHLVMVQRVVGLIHLGRPIELFLVPASAPRLVQQSLLYVLSCLWVGAYKRTLAANWKE